MSLSIDAAAVLRVFADHSEIFPAIQADIGEFARKALTKQIKHKSFTLSVSRSADKWLGGKPIKTTLDGFSQNELAAVLKKLDPNNPLVKTGDPTTMRAAIDRLISGDAEPMAKAQKTATTTSRTPASKAKAPKIGNVLESKVHAGDAAGRSSRSKNKT